MCKKLINGFCIMLVLVISTACGNSNLANVEENNEVSFEYEEKFVENFEVDESIKNVVAEQILSIYDTNTNDFPDYKYSDWRIIDLELAYQYDDLEGLELEVYRVGFELLSEEPENVMLVGGMYMTEDNWVCPTYPNSTYFIFENDGSTIDHKFIFSIMENDCSPGSETFTEDLVRKIKAEYL